MSWAKIKFYCGLPFQATQSDYEKVSESLVTRWMSLSSPPETIFQIGQIKAPGISDLDYIVVYDSSKGPIPVSEYQPGAYDTETRKFYTHSVYFSSTDSWNELPACLPIFDLKLLAGKKMGVVEQVELEKPGLALVNLVNYLSIKMPSDLLQFAWSDEIHVRTTLCILNSFKYILVMYESAFGEKVPTGWREISEEIQSLRTGWKSIPSDYATMSRVIERTIEVIGELTKETAARIASKIHGALPATTVSAKDLVHFEPNWSLKQAITVARSGFNTSGIPTWTVPMEFLAVLGQNSKDSAEFRSYVRGLLGADIPCGLIECRWTIGLKRYATSVVRYENCVSRMGVPPSKYVSLGYKRHRSLFVRGIKKFQKEGIVGLIASVKRKIVAKLIRD